MCCDMLRSEVHSTRDVFPGAAGLKNSYDMSPHSPRQHLPGSKKVGLVHRACSAYHAERHRTDTCRYIVSTPKTESPFSSCAFIYGLGDSE